jgi:hypothetical protein
MSKADAGSPDSATSVTGSKPRKGVKVRRPRRHHHSVYVVLLSKDVLYEPKFRRCNPDYDPAKPCVYVGMTGLSPDDRFDKHKAGIRANRYVKDFGLRLLPEHYECYNPMPYDAALDMEVELAIHLRERGYGVWQG